MPALIRTIRMPFLLVWILVLIPVFTADAISERFFYPHLLSKIRTSSTNEESIPEADEIHFTVTGQNSVTFDWRGRAEEIRFGKESRNYYRSAKGETPHLVPSSSAFAFHEAKLTDLDEDTLYYYSIGDSEEHTFHTPPLIASDSSFSIAVQGDISESKSNPNVTKVQALIANINPDFVIVAGDLAYNNQTGRASVDRHFNDLMVWSRDKAYMPIWGNHELSDAPEENYINYVGRFDLPNAESSPNSELPGSNEDWYWFDYGNTRFIAYPEEMEGAWDDWNTKMNESGGPMNLAQNDDHIRYIVTFGHKPAYSSGRQQGEEQLQIILDGLGRKYSKYVLSLNGHSHNYERTFPQSGVTYVTVGTGGKDLQRSGNNEECPWRDCTPPEWSAKRYMRYGALKLSFDENAIKGEFFCGPADEKIRDIDCEEGKVIDQFTILPSRE